jgi:hypothetical protein
VSGEWLIWQLLRCSGFQVRNAVAGRIEDLDLHVPFWPRLPTLKVAKMFRLLRIF